MTFKVAHFLLIKPRWSSIDAMCQIVPVSKTSEQHSFPDSCQPLPTQAVIALNLFGDYGEDFTGLSATNKTRCTSQDATEVCYVYLTGPLLRSYFHRQLAISATEVEFMERFDDIVMDLILIL